MAQFCSEISQSFWQEGGGEEPPSRTHPCVVARPVWAHTGLATAEFFQRTTGISVPLDMKWLTPCTYFGHYTLQVTLPLDVEFKKEQLQNLNVGVGVVRKKTTPFAE